ncbi:histidine kinase [Mucilaginibacter rigui]|uniref:Histidine kinase n=1 Tax=Mucilaginibacter rigui TaxID=534635 RepID=A0ABR7X966_9SPHI|nr:sensor histidine kinase [Mucilaginibacter rigui]MBD1387124.1 histidine kinase [Mucilaginibacter rigui]
MLRLKTFSVIIHIACWLLFMALPLLFVNGRNGSSSLLVLLASPYYWLFCLTFITLFYLNSSLMFPLFFLKKRYITYAAICVCLLVAVCFLKPFEKLLRNSEGWRSKMAMQIENRQQFEQQRARRDSLFKSGKLPSQFGQRWQGGRRKHFDSISLFFFLMIMALSTAIKTVQQWQLTEQRAISAEAEKANAELSFLKAQINPHFLFNTLNNIYTLAITNNANTAESIMKLSNIMRYVTDDVTENFVSLQSEVDCIVDYIDLQRLRLGSKTTVNFNITGTIAQQKIAPLLFMTFVENVFKYGVSKQHESAIDINLHIADDIITFMCVNPVFERKEHIERTGIGIANTKQRMEHLYPGKHVLNIADDNDQFTVVLTLYI